MTPWRPRLTRRRALAQSRSEACVFSGIGAEAQKGGAEMIRGVSIAVFREKIMFISVGMLNGEQGCQFCSIIKA